jgi:hypothetical protein
MIAEDLEKGNGLFAKALPGGVCRAKMKTPETGGLWRLNSVYSQGIGPYIVPFSLVTGCRFPRLPCLQAVPAMGATSFLALRILWRCRLQNPRVSPNL